MLSNAGSSGRPAFKKKTVKGKGKARARESIFAQDSALEDLEIDQNQDSTVFARPTEKRAVSTGEKNALGAEGKSKSARWAQFAKLASPEIGSSVQDGEHKRERESSDGSMAESPNIPTVNALLSDAVVSGLDSPLIANAGIDESPMIVDALAVDVQAKPASENTAGQIYVAPKTFLLRESHFRDKPIQLEREYDDLSDDEKPKVQYEDDDQMQDGETFLHDAPTRFDLEMYESEIMSVASDDHHTGRKIVEPPSVADLLSSLGQRVQELLLDTESRKVEIQDLKVHLEGARAARERILSQLRCIMEKSTQG